MKNENIVKGYNGIMDLDLTNVNKAYHKELIKQHYQDIENYKLEQKKLNPELRYENSVLVALKKIEYENRIIHNRFMNRK